MFAHPFQPSSLPRFQIKQNPENRKRTKALPRRCHISPFYYISHRKRESSSSSGFLVARADWDAKPLYCSCASAQVPNDQFVFVKPLCQGLQSLPS